MKKYILILFSVFYLVIISGVNLNLHYCGGKIISVSLFHSKNDIGCCGKKMTKKGCCQDKTTFIKVKEKHLSNADIKFEINKNLASTSIDYYTVFYLTINKNDIELINDYNPPPPNYKTPIFIKNRVLII